MTAHAELAKHTVRHRLTLTADARRLRCHDCSVWILLPSAVASTSTSTPDPRPDEQCDRHPGEWSHACRCCRAEQLEGERIPHRGLGSGTPPTAAYQAARAALPRRPAPVRASTPSAPENGSQPADPTSQTEPTCPAPCLPPDLKETDR